MTQTKHTAGLWETAEDSGGLYVRELAHQCNICKLSKAKGYEGEMHANARLISASPDLLEALKHVIAKDGNERINQVKNELFRLAPELKPMIESAINKAEGR